MRTRQQFDADLLRLDQHLHSMGDETADMLAKAMLALTGGDVVLAAEVIDQDDVVDRLNSEIEIECMRLVIQQQPIAHDLRQIGMIYKAIDDIERIADHAVDIARIAISIDRECRYETLVDVLGLAARVRDMFANSMTTFTNYDLDMVARVVADDDMVDDMFHAQRAKLLEIMQSNPQSMTLASHLIFVVQFLERIGDRCVNIAERAHQVASGTRPKHSDSSATP